MQCISVLCRCVLGSCLLWTLFGLFPVLVSCDYEFIRCLSHYLWLSCVFIVLFVQVDLVWCTRYSPVFPSVSALSCPTLSCLVLSCLALPVLIMMFCVPGSRVAYELIHSQAAASVSQHTRFWNGADMSAYAHIRTLFQILVSCLAV